ncbi:TrkA family potassium uptake protein [Clostridium sediminicola]|uniref:potassium channel family protein n=1 Tax=Clostridium sediminicola TaxID=3114879 RepID=UPI0031F270CE
MKKKQFVVIGLGRFGYSIAKELYLLGNDVLAIDADEDMIQSISDHVTHAVQADATDENSLRTLGISNFDVAIITIGSNVQASIMAALLVKDLGVKYILTKAHNELHAKVLIKLGVDKVIFPERDMGVRVAHNLVSSNILDYIELSSDYSIAEIASPESWFGKTLKELNMRSNFGINVMALKRNNEVNVSPSANDVIQKGDVIVAMGGSEEINKIEEIIK